MTFSNSNSTVTPTYLENYLDSPVRQLLPDLQDRVLNQATYWGIPTQKNPNDLWVYLNIVFEQQPDLIIEIGTGSGGSALALAHQCALIGKGRVIGLDTDQKRVAEVVRNYPIITLLEGTPEALFPQIAAQIRSNDKVLIIVGNGQALHTLQTYSALVRPGGYLIIESDLGQDAAAFVAAHPAFEVDRSRESFIFSGSVKGFLKRQENVVAAETTSRAGQAAESSTELRQLQKDWNYLGEVDPLWAILSNPTKLGGHWNLEEFFQTGVAEIDAIMNYMQRLGIQVPHRYALDFGCGVGRLTQALCRNFEQCAGVDIAASMIERARTLNRYGDRCQYYLNSADDLSLFSTGQFDFIYSNIVFQHMPPQFSTKYLKECLRTLQPGGIFIFQIPSHLVPPPPPTAGTTYLPARVLNNREYRARIQIIQIPESAPAGSAVTLRARIKNESSAIWPVSGEASGKYQIKLANHWRDAAGKLLAIDDGRTILPGDMKPQDEVELDLVVHTPRTEGHYILELDLVQEMIVWFGDKGSTTTQVGFNVTAAPQAAPSPSIAPTVVAPQLDQTASTLPNYIKMFQVPRPEVEQLMKDNGAELLDVIQNQAAGPEWVSFQYCARKRD